MEDTKSLLMMVLHKIFQNQPKTIENTFQLIHNFNNGKIEKKNYEKTLKTICDLMNDELPSPILVYILTLVDMPQDLHLDVTSPIVEKMRKTHDFFPEINVRPHLLEYLNKIKLTRNTKHRKEDKQEVLVKSQSVEVSVPEVKTPDKNAFRFLKPTKVVKKTKKSFSKITGSPKRLLDICAIYVVTNENMLKVMYRKKQILAWRLIDSNLFSDNKLTQCYDVVKDLNKKTKWLREIEAENISSEVLAEEYKNSDIFLHENFMFNKLERDPFVLSEECENAINALFKFE